jgi:IPT/TIG domain/Glucose / Sorbosone dehydrogenase
MRRSMHHTYVVVNALLATIVVNAVNAHSVDDETGRHLLDGPQPSESHRAHAVPGGPFYLVDWDRDGEEAVTFDAGNSHSHYFHAGDSGKPNENGVIVSYTWTSITTGAVLYTSADPRMSGRFFLGTTLLQLAVTDTTGDVASAHTFVSVRMPYAWEKNAPHVKAISANSSATYGGAVLTLTGYGFYNSPVVMFGSAKAEVIKVESNTQMLVKVPVYPKPDRVLVLVNNNFGSGTSDIHFDFYKSDVANVRFETDWVKDKQGNKFEISEVTSLRVGPDGLYYAATLDGFIYTIELSVDMVVSSYCKSPQVGNDRSILGLAFNPDEISLPPKVYASTSTLYWGSKDNGDGWNNGKVEVWQRGAQNESCMGHLYDLVTGLPVSNHDHAVNALEFLNNGDLLVSVGSSTNAGVETNGDGVGGIPESPLSGAILLVQLSRGKAFNGSVKYTTDKPDTADVASGNVSVYAAGLRNCFGMTLHSNGKVYAMINGANDGFGVASDDCNTVGKNVTYQDSLVNVFSGNYYGHPNRNRGRSDERQCKYMVGNDAYAGKPRAEGYTKEMVLVDSSTNGIVEYTSNAFDGQLRGNLFLSRLAWGGPGRAERVVLSSSGDAVVQKTELYAEGGLSIVMSPYGALLMPKVKQASIFVLRPVYTPTESVHLGAIWPRRGPAVGGNMVLVTGTGFSDDMTVTFGGKKCGGVARVAVDGSSAWCKMPAGKPQTVVAAVVTVDGVASKKDTNAYQYTW